MFQLVTDHNDFLVIDKSPNVSFHAERQTPGLLAHIRKQTGIDQLFPVHRLDKMASGLLLLAKNRLAAKELASLFQRGEVVKFYLAISAKKPKKKQGLVIGDMHRSRRGTWKLSPDLKNPAKTRFHSFSIEPGLRLFLLRPHTGKTHQLRVAMKSLGAPIAGDPLYNTASSNSAFDRGYLHAFALAFSLNDQNFTYLCQPTAGALFQKNSCQAKIKAVTPPWPYEKALKNY